MTTTIHELARLCNAEIIGNHPATPIVSAANIDEAGPDQVSFIAGSKYLAKLATTGAGAVIVPEGVTRESAPAETCLLRVADPEMAFITCLNHLYPEKPNPGTVSDRAQVEPSAVIGPGSYVDPHASVGAKVSIGSNCQVHAGCRIGDDVSIGNNCVLHPNVVLYHGVRLGDNVTIHAGTVIGADGFGYKLRNGEHVKFPQVGTVVIESNVEIGANTCIDRAALGVTRVGNGAKIDNQVHIAHNVQIGARVLLCGQVGIGGSTVIGDYAVLAAQSGVADHVTVGKQAVVLAQAGVTKDIAPKDQVMGFPAANRREALHQMAAVRKLASQQREIEELVRLLPRLRSASGECEAGAAEESAEVAAILKPSVM
jgi:UDP-3-O-[3-hydroxymyristoyl] glucosamine N-acyltransferase